jgi:hypothetical protein
VSGDGLAALPAYRGLDKIAFIHNGGHHAPLLSPRFDRAAYGSPGRLERGRCANAQALIPVARLARRLRIKTELTKLAPILELEVAREPQGRGPSAA